MKFVGIISAVTLLVAATMAPIASGTPDCETTTTSKCRTKTITKTTSDRTCSDYTTTTTQSCPTWTGCPTTTTPTCSTDTACTVFTHVTKHGKITVTDRPHPTCYKCIRREPCPTVCTRYETVIIQKGLTPDCEDLDCRYCREAAEDCGGFDNPVIRIPPREVVGIPVEGFQEKAALQADPMYVRPTPCGGCYEPYCKKTTTKICVGYKTLTRCLKEVHGKCVKTGCALLNPN